MRTVVDSSSAYDGPSTFNNDLFVLCAETAFQVYMYFIITGKLRDMLIMLMVNVLILQSV